MSEEDAVTKLHDLCRRHGDHVWAGLRRIQEVFDDPLQPLKQGLLPQLIRTRAYLDHSGHELQRLMSTLESIHPGNDDAYTYERTIQGILTELFRGHLTDPVAQTVQDGGLRRVDITFRNISKEGFFDDVKFKRAPFILFECKNYSSDPAQGAFNQLRSNLGDGGKPEVGFLVCRRLVDRPHALQLCKSKYPEVLMMVLEDSDIGALVCAKMKGRSGDMWRELGDQMRGIVMKS